MPITAEHVRTTLGTYLAEHPEEKAALAGLVEALDEAGDDISSRKSFGGHVTAGAILLRPDNRILMIEHRALKKWLLPGGHCEPEDGTLLQAALRELAEETGVDAARVIPVTAEPVQVDWHEIPPSEGKQEPAHIHYDFRFLFRSPFEDVTLQAEEVTGFEWRAVDHLHDETLRARVKHAMRTW